jgi:hypothetical protein
MTEQEHKWVETNRAVCAMLRQMHDALALSSLPPQRKWVGLTEDERVAIMWDLAYPSRDSLARAIEAKLKENNNG